MHLVSTGCSSKTDWSDIKLSKSKNLSYCHHLINWLHFHDTDGHDVVVFCTLFEDQIDRIRFVVPENI